jgi:voltage-gated hydrogen channel 1
LQAWVHGFRRFISSVLHAVDLTIVITSLLLELLALLLHDSAIEVGGLIVVFRLWRVVRVMQAVGEVQHKRTHEEISSLKEANKQLHEMQKAHHEVIKGLHREFLQRVRLTVLCLQTWTD